MAIVSLYSFKNVCNTCTFMWGFFGFCFLNSKSAKSYVKDRTILIY